MKLYLPDSKERKSLMITSLILIGLIIIGLCGRFNDWLGGHLSEWFHKGIDWLIAKKRIVER